MKHLMHIASVVLLASACEFANAEIGTLDEAISAAKNNQEPAYIKDLMFQLSEKLHTLALDNKVHSSKARVAWLLTMRSIMSVTFWTTLAAAKAETIESGWQTAWNAFRDGSWNRDFDASNNASWTAAKQAAKDGCWAAACRTAENAYESGRPTNEERRIAYRAAEWGALNYLLTNIEAIVAQTYEAAFSELPEYSAENPFESHDIWTFYFDFTGLSSDATIFLAPWLVPVLPLDWVPALHKPLFVHLFVLNNDWSSMFQFFAGSEESNSILSSLPKELVAQIMLFAAQSQHPA